MTINLEKARAFDGPEIAAILSSWIDETPWMPRIYTRQQDQGFGGWLIKVCDVTVARSKGIVVGFLARQQIEVHALYLEERARGQGIGTLLLDHAKREQRNLKLWTFQANLGARQFYGRNGFVESKLSDGRDNDEKLPDVRMNWTRS